MKPEHNTKSCKGFNSWSEYNSAKLNCEELDNQELDLCPVYRQKQFKQWLEDEKERDIEFNKEQLKIIEGFNKRLLFTNRFNFYNDTISLLKKLKGDK